MRIGIEELGARHCAAKNRANRPLSAPPKLYEPRVHHRRFEHQKKTATLAGWPFSLSECRITDSPCRTIASSGTAGGQA